MQTVSIYPATIDIGNRSNTRWSRFVVPCLVAGGIAICYALLFTGVLAVYRLVFDTDAPARHDATVAMAADDPQAAAAPRVDAERAPTYGPTRYRVVSGQIEALGEASTAAGAQALWAKWKLTHDVASTGHARTIVIDVPMAAPPPAAPPPAALPAARPAPRVDQAANPMPAPIRRTVRPDGSVLYTNGQ